MELQGLHLVDISQVVAAEDLVVSLELLEDLVGVVLERQV
jgi:hypothetical protein